MSADTVKCFLGTDSFDTSVRALKLAEKLGIEVISQTGGTHWAQIKVNDQCEKISFFQPSHAYAYLLGVEAALKGIK